MPLVFFYGTLLRNGANHDVLERLAATFRGEARTKSPRMLVDLGPYPAVLSIEAATKLSLPTAPIIGEVWEVNNEALIDLDTFEGCPDLYVREEIAVTLLHNNEERVVFTYVLTADPPKTAKRITSGRYEHAGIPLPFGAKSTKT